MYCRSKYGGKKVIKRITLHNVRNCSEFLTNTGERKNTNERN
jgi:hypothetical protein